MKSIKKEVYKTLKILNSNGYEAYIVGGAVRSLLLGQKIHDYDITTNASSNVIKLLFAKYPMFIQGEKHGTVVVIVDKVKIDITTYRKDDVYLDYRHPSNVSFSDDLNEDLKRRDFTINALCLDAKDNLIDNYGGIEDLKAKVIRAIGEPTTRFSEDALRILRALRFKAKLDFEIEDNTKKAMFEKKDLLKFISNERKKEELLSILSSKHRYFTINDYLEIFNTFIPFNKVDKKIDEFSNPYFALAYLLSNTTNYDLKKLKFSKQEINLLEALIDASKINIDDDFNFITLLCDPYAKEILNYLNELFSKDYNLRYKSLKKYMVNINDLNINGEDLMLMGYKGKQIKEVQLKLVELIRKKVLRNNSKQLLSYIKNSEGKCYNLKDDIKKD